MKRIEIRMHDDDEIRVTSVRHESSAAFAGRLERDAGELLRYR